MKIRLAIIFFISSILNVTLVQAGTPVSNDAKTLYKDECSACHIAYPARLLPARSWNKIMTNLNNHFGDNASLDPETVKTLNHYLQKNSAHKSWSRRANKFKHPGEPDYIPTRITELPYFKHEHNEIPSRFIKANPRVKSLSNCGACHQGAERGNFNEHQVRIPGYEQWDD